MVSDFFLVACGAAGMLLLLWAIGDDRNDRELNYWRERALRAEDQVDEGLVTGQEMELAVLEMRQALQQQKLEADLWRGVAQMRNRLDGGDPDALPDVETFEAEQSTVATLIQVLSLPVLHRDPASAYLRRTERN